MAAQSSTEQNANINPVRNCHEYLPPPRDLLRQMFEDESGDWEMIAKDGKSFKVHQTVLKQVHSFQTFFSNPTTVECSNKQVVIPQEVNMCGTSLEAFLRYLYYRGTLGMQKSFSVTCALIRAGHSFNVPNLVEDAVIIFKSIRHVGSEDEVLKWFNVPELWELYQQVWQWEEAHPFKSKLIKIITDVFKVFVLHNAEQRDKLISIAGTNPIFGNLFSALVEPVGGHAFANIARNTTSGHDDESSGEDEWRRLDQRNGRDRWRARDGWSGRNVVQNMDNNSIAAIHQIILGGFDQNLENRPN